MRCLSCQIHVLYRIVVRFTKEAVLAQRHLPILEKFSITHSAHIRWETPEFSAKTKHMTGAVATIIIDRWLPDAKKRTVYAFAKAFKAEFNPDDLDEGFLEIHEISDIIDLIEEEKPVCKTKKKLHV